jgi:hypothetical protein
MSESVVMMKVQTAEKLMLREMIFIRGFQPKFFKHLRIILCTIISISVLRGDSQIQCTEPHSFLVADTFIITNRSFIQFKTQNVIWIPKIAEDIYQHTIFLANRDFQILVPPFERLACGGNIEGGRGIYINECRDGGKGRY